MWLSTEEFKDLVAQALDELPDEFLQLLNNVDVVVEDRPPPELERRWEGLLLGLYQGVPLNRRSVMGMQLPDKISLYRRNILRVCRSRSQVRRQVKKTVLHEIGHHFGLNEKEIREAGY